MQVKVDPKDRPFLRFLWKNNGRIETYEYTSHIFGATDSPCIASYALRRSAQDNAKTYPSVQKVIERNIYMDDLYVAVSSPNEASNIVHETRKVLATGGFNLTKWNSNSQQVLDLLNPDIRLNPETSAPQSQKVLGLPWFPEADTFVIEQKLFHKIKLDEKTSQRKLLRFVASIFDPLGIIAPFTIRFRKVLQAAWNHGPKWDKPLQLDENSDFENLKKELSFFKDVHLPRKLLNEIPISSIELHTFTDASELALSAVSYLRIEHIDESVSVAFVIGKARVAPIKRMTIPNLELQAAVYGAQLAQFVRDEMDIEIHKQVFWSDSTTVLYWLRTPEIRHRIFIANRLAKILDVSSAQDWFYISSTRNPADDGTRGYNVHQMNVNSRWLLGPSFLCQNKNTWPKQDLLSAQHVKIIMADPRKELKCQIDISRFSNWNRLLRVAALCFLFADKCRKKESKLLLAHYTKAYNYLIKSAQNQDFKLEISNLRKGIAVSSTSRIVSLSPYVDHNQHLRARGRLSKALRLETARFPLILDGNNQSVRLLIKHFHQTNMHCGTEQTRSLLMELYWILRCRAVVKQTVRQCIPCRRMIQEVAAPQMADLPEFRLPRENHHVFQTTGLDFVGPFPVKEHGRNRTRYILLFTCLVVRAVHLEVAVDLTTDSTINCIRRFISRRGKPKKFFSDCGKSFVGSNNSLQSSIASLRNSQDFASHFHLMQVEIEWVFNPPAAPHFGGSWERLVQIFKLSLYKVIGSRTLSDDILWTLVCEIESNMNSRPLTNVPSEINDPLPLTPNHFLLGRASLNYPPGLFESQKVTVSRSWKSAQELASHFWNRFLREYIPNQQTRSKWNKTSENLKVNDLVWLLEDFTPRGLWHLAKVIEIYPGSDGVVRSVKLRTPHGEKVRPVIKLSKVLINK